MNNRVYQLIQAGANQRNYQLVVDDILGIFANESHAQKSLPVAAEIALDKKTTPYDVFNACKKAFGMTTSDFAEISTRRIVNIIQNFPEPLHRKLSMFIEMPDFIKTEIMSGFDNIAAFDLLEGGEIPHTYVIQNEAVMGSPARKGTRVIISPELLRNRTDWLVSLPRAIMASAYRNERNLFFRTLQDNANMPDGQPLFIDGVNSISGATFTDLLQAFREQKTPSGSEYINEEPAYIACPPGQEKTIREDLKAMELQQKINVIVSAGINCNYLLCEPLITPAIARLGINDKPLIIVEAVPGGGGSLALTLSHTVKFVPVSRVGIVRQIIS